MSRFFLSAVVSQLGFCVADVDALVKAKLATLGQKSGKTTVVMDLHAAEEFVNDRRKYRR